MASVTTQMLRGMAVVGSGLVWTVYSRVHSLPWEVAPKMLVPVWSQSARQVTRTEAQLTVGVRFALLDLSVKKKMLVSLGTGRGAIAVG